MYPPNFDNEGLYSSLKLKWYFEIFMANFIVFSNTK